MGDVTYTVDAIYGEVKIKPVEYWITPKADGYWIECEFSSLGPFDTRKEASDIIKQYCLATTGK